MIKIKFSSRVSSTGRRWADAGVVWCVGACCGLFKLFNPIRVNTSDLWQVNPPLCRPARTLNHMHISLCFHQNELGANITRRVVIVPLQIMNVYCHCCYVLLAHYKRCTKQSFIRLCNALSFLGQQTLLFDNVVEIICFFYQL